MIRSIVPVMVLIVVSAITPRAAHAQSGREDVLAAIDGFLEGMHAKDTTAMRRYIDPATRMTLLRPGPNGVRVVVLSANDFINAVVNPNQPALDEPIRNAVVHIDGDLATVWAEYQVRNGRTVTHCGFDSFQLARLGGQWKILNVSDSFRQTGCGAAW